MIGFPVVPEEAVEPPADLLEDPDSGRTLVLVRGLVKPPGHEARGGVDLDDPAPLAPGQVEPRHPVASLGELGERAAGDLADLGIIHIQRIDEVLLNERQPEIPVRPDPGKDAWQWGRLVKYGLFFLLIS